jgi:hypothetical protein
MQEILQPADWARPKGYSNGIAIEGSGKMVFVAGQLGANAQGQIERATISASRSARPSATWCVWCRRQAAVPPISCA